MNFHDHDSHDIARPKPSFLCALPFKRNLVQKPVASPPSCALPLTPTQGRCRASFVARIATWASLVQPGSPAPAREHGCTFPTSRVRNPSPTSACHKTFDFTAIGYNSLFEHSKAPNTPSILLPANAESRIHLNEEHSQRTVQTERTRQPINGHDEHIPTSPSTPPSNDAVRPGPMLLSIPARPFRAAKHLRNPRFMFDVQAFADAMRTNATASQARSPRSPLFAHASQGTAAQAANSPRTRIKRRPAPLKISPAMQRMRMVVAVSSPGSGVPPLSSRVAGFSYRQYPASNVPATVVSPLSSMTRLMHDGKLEFATYRYPPEVSVFEDDSECDFVR